jgi:UDPglucose 6-dehydrogenase
MARIVIVGGGVVGAASGEGLARRGHDVTLVDRDPGRRRQLRERGLQATDHLDLTGPEAFVFLALPTPAGTSGYDLSALMAGAASVGAALRDASSRHVVALRSTVPPFTTERLVAPHLERLSGRRVGRDFAVAYVPEFLRSASALEDVESPRMTVVASRDPRARARLAELFRPFGGELRTFDDPTTAEVVKLAQNAFNAAKISFWNEMWRLCGRLGVDADDVATTVAGAAEASVNPAYGIRGGTPYGGMCLPKDVQGLLAVGRELGIELPLLAGVEQVNAMVGGRGAGSPGISAAERRRPVNAPSRRLALRRVRRAG